MDLTSYLMGRKSSGGGSGVIDWSQIGYESTPQSLIDDFNYSKEIMDNWDSSQTNLNMKFQNDKKIFYMPLVDTSNVVSMNQTFRDSNLKSIPLLDTSKCTDFHQTFNSCPYLTSIPKIDTSAGTMLAYMFAYSTNLITIPELDTSSANNTKGMFAGCTNIENIPLLDCSRNYNMNGMFDGCQKLNDTSLDNILQMCIKSHYSYKTLASIGFGSSAMKTTYPVSRIEALPHYQDFLDAGWTIGY